MQSREQIEIQPEYMEKINSGSLRYGNYHPSRFYLSYNFLVKITNIFDERQDKVLSERWKAIMGIKDITNSINIANMNIEHVKTALAVFN